METKKCTKCKKIKNVEEFYWRKTRNNFSPKCKICWIEDSKKYNKKHKSERKEYLKEWRKDNDKLRKYQREYKRKALSQDRIIFNLRNRVYKLMLKEYQSQETLELIGCSRKEFMSHLENQFTDKMNWENYGDYWEVDHILPLSKGGTIHWSNSQPLTVSENRKKSNKIQ
ncbi:HNH endonuclease [bacterium]|nr:HNH endonuclease [bacterium]